MFLDYLDRIREKPRAARQRFAFVGALILTGLIGAGWAFTLPARFASLSIGGDSMMAGVGMDELTDELSAGREGFEEVVAEGQNLPGYVSPELEQQLRAEGFIQGGGGNDAPLTQESAIASSSVTSETSSSTEGEAPEQKPRPIMIVTTSTTVQNTSTTTP